MKPLSIAIAGWLTSIRESIFKNPIAWLAFGAFVIAEYSNYQRGAQVEWLCQMTEPHPDVFLTNPVSPRDQLDTFCARLGLAREEAEDNSN